MPNSLNTTELRSIFFDHVKNEANNIYIAAFIYLLFNAQPLFIFIFITFIIIRLLLLKWPLLLLLLLVVAVIVVAVAVLVAILSLLLSAVVALIIYQ